MFLYVCFRIVSPPRRVKHSDNPRRMDQKNMYFGSVKFFKHLIYTVFFSWIAAATFLAVFFGIKYFKNEEKLVIPKGTSIEHIFLAMTAQGYSTEDMLPLIESGDEQVFLDYVRSCIEQDPQLAEQLGILPPETDTETEDGKTEDEGTALPAIAMESPYMELYPELYAEDPPAAFKEDTGTVYLTFDDGPSDRTLEILEILGRYDIKATFFFSGGNGEKEQEIMKKVAEAGHAVGVHSISHDYEKVYASVESYLDDFNETYMSIYNATGIKPSIFRFPGGSINNYNRFTYMQIIAEMTRRGFVYYDWNVSGEDAVHGADWTSIYNNIISGIQSNSADRAIVLLHDSESKEATVLVLEDIIDKLLNDGYKFDKIDNTVNPATFTYRD